MSDLLGHWAVFDDVRRLASHDQEVAPLFKSILAAHEVEARLGALSRGGGWWVCPILQELRPLAQALEPKTEAEDDLQTAARRRLAYALGGVLHYPADLYVKPLLKKFVAAGENKRVVSAYYDAEIFREIYLAGSEAPFSSFLLAANTTSPGKALEKFINALFQRSLLSSHTLAPPREDFSAWLDALLAKVQPLYIDIELYCKIWEMPDEEMVQRLEVRSSFYQSNDPAIRLAAKVRGGDSTNAVEIDPAIEAHANQSAYGQALALGTHLLREFSEWWKDDSKPLPSVVQ